MEIDIQAFFTAQFGFATEGEKIEIDGTDSRIINRKSGEKWYRNDPDDLYGRPVFMPITIGGLFLPYCWITLMSGGKKIIETDLTERRGRVKEFIAEDDMTINVRGFVVNNDGTFPEAQVENLRDLWRRNEAVEIDCPLTDIFLLTNETGAQDSVVIYDYRILERKGVEHVCGFEFSMRTDQEFELELK